VTRSVRDSALLLDIASVPQLGDPYWAAPPQRRQWWIDRVRACYPLMS